MSFFQLLLSSGVIGFTLVLSYFCHVIFEAPFANLIKMMLKRRGSIPIKATEAVTRPSSAVTIPHEDSNNNGALTLNGSVNGGRTAFVVTNYHNGSAGKHYANGTDLPSNGFIPNGYSNGHHSSNIEATTNL